MARLTDLPNELLILITKNLRTEKDVNSLCRTSRHLYGVLNPTLYSQNVHLHRSRALCWAAQYNRVDTARILVAADADAFTVLEEWDYLPPILLAAKFGGVEMTKFLLDCGAEWKNCPLLNAVLACWTSPLALAARGGHVEVVKLYLENLDASPASKTRDRTPISDAAETGAIEVLDLLLSDDRFDVSTRDCIGMLPLHHAADTEEDNTAVIRRLLEDPRVDIAPVDRRGFSALHLAAIIGNSANVRALLEAGADASQRGHEGATPLSLAASGGHADAVSALLGVQGVDPNEVNDLGLTPLISAAYEGSGAAISRLLSNERTLPNLTSRLGETALMVAARKGFSDCVRQLLLREDTDVNLGAEQGRFILYEAMGSGGLETVRLLVEDERLDRLTTDEAGWTPMFHAAANDDAEVVKMLYRDGRFSIDDLDTCGGTAMSIAAQAGAEDVVKVLLEIADEVEGLEWDVEDDEGMTAVDHAIDGGYSAIVKLICDHNDRNYPSD